ncbi:MAG TPA: hypothetical protein VET85_03750 [Stellaceae bacterium]|nr:hypothetical protein [Stellaceae bacterium]
MTPKLRRLCVFFLLGASLAACGARGPKMENVQFPPLAPSVGRVYFYRASIFGNSIELSGRLNGQKVGDCKPYGVFFRDVQPGAYQVTATVGNEPTRARSVTVAAGEEKFIRCSVLVPPNQPGAVGDVTVVSKEEAREEMRGLAYTGKTSPRPQ